MMDMPTQGTFYSTNTFKSKKFGYTGRLTLPKLGTTVYVGPGKYDTTNTFFPKPSDN